MQRGSVAAALVASAFLSAPAYAQNNAACLLMGRVEQMHVQPLNEYALYLRIQGVRSNNTLANSVECGKVFKTGSGLWVSLNTATIKSESAPDEGQQIWLSLRYMESQGMVLRKYEVISRETYLEKKDGIQ